MAPTVSSLQQLVTICEQYSNEFGIKFNPSKTVCIAFGQKTVNGLSHIKLDNKVIDWSQAVKHLGNYVTATLND